ncbi:uncharacterized protein LOC133896327 [Phragmites australis]|uniref:uncharacterized protein LOC133896327 n=1 Tax=Phragmites australis TaxID=29695 RepID=UPI002D772267|nr:uncharacterized protein LOC133896327 [Phragmites australis]
MPPAMAFSNNSGAHTTADEDYGFSAGRGEKLPYPTLTAAGATEQGAAYCNPSMHADKAILLAPQAVIDKATAADVGHDMNDGALAERVLRGLPILGLAVASSAVTALATATPTPAMGFGLFLMILIGLSAVSIRVLCA